MIKANRGKFLKDFEKKEYEYFEKILGFIVGFILTTILFSVIFGFIALFLFTGYKVLHSFPLIKLLCIKCLKIIRR